MSVISSSPSARGSLLAIPKELRLDIYTCLFTGGDSVISVEPSFSNGLDSFDVGSDLGNGASDGDYWRMSRYSHPRSSQLLRTNKQIYAEALPLLYHLHTFDCTVRDGIKLVNFSIPPIGFHSITSLTLDWDQLLDLSFQFAKPSFVYLTSNLSCVTMAHWRTRVLGGSSMLWRDVKSYERTIVESALAIVEKSTQLRVVAQHHWVGKMAGSKGTRGNGSFMSQSQDFERPRKATTSRVKWRFLASGSQTWEEETIVDLKADLAMLTAKRDDEGERSVQSALDPF